MGNIIHFLLNMDKFDQYKVIGYLHKYKKFIKDPIETEDIMKNHKYLMKIKNLI